MAGITPQFHCGHSIRIKTDVSNSIRIKTDVKGVQKNEDRYLGTTSIS